MRTLALGKYKLNHRRDPAGNDISFSHTSNPVPSAVKGSGDYIIPNLPPLLDQGQLGTCHDANTEVLTEDGWLLFADLTGEERLASVDPKTSKLIYEKPIRIIRMPFDGDLVIGYNEQSLDFAVTPDHKMLVRKWDLSDRTLSSEYTFVNAKDLGWYSGLMNRVVWEGEGSDTYTLPGVPDHKHKAQRCPKQFSMGIWLQFLGIYLAEGTMCLDPKNYKIQFAAVKDREQNYIRSLLAEMGLNACVRDDRITFDNRQIYEEMTRLGLKSVYAPDKFVPSFVFKQSAENIKKFLLGHFMGDGSQQRECKVHYTSSAQLADDLQLLIFLSGDESRIGIREPRTSVMSDGREIVGKYPEHRISVCALKNLSIERSESISHQHYSGEVFCAEVPTYHTLVTRRNNKILISGNCAANASSGALQVILYNEDPPINDEPSRRLIYWCATSLDGTAGQDSGTYLRSCVQQMHKIGVCTNQIWPYSDKIESLIPPPPEVIIQASQNRIYGYYKIDSTGAQRLADICTAIRANHPVIFGTLVGNAFMNTDGRTPLVPETNNEGGHGTCLVGVQSTGGRLSFRDKNSWGNSWADGGYCWLDQDYMTWENTSDLWVITRMDPIIV